MCVDIFFVLINCLPNILVIFKSLDTFFKGYDIVGINNHTKFININLVQLIQLGSNNLGRYKGGTGWVPQYLQAKLSF